MTSAPIALHAESLSAPGLAGITNKPPPDWPLERGNTQIAKLDGFGVEGHSADHCSEQAMTAARDVDPFVDTTASSACNDAVFRHPTDAVLTG